MKYPKDDILAIYQKITGATDIDKIINILFNALDSIVKTDYKVIYLLDEENKSLKLYHICSPLDQKNYFHDMLKIVKGQESPLSAHNLEQECFKKRKLISFFNTKPKKELSQGYVMRFENNSFATSVFIPILLNNKAIGVIVVYSITKNIKKYLEKMQSYINIFAKSIQTGLKVQKIEEKLDAVHVFLEKNEKITSLATDLNQLSDNESLYLYFMEKMMAIFHFDIAAIQLKENGLLPIRYMIWQKEKYKEYPIKAMEVLIRPENIHQIRGDEGASALAIINKNHFYFENIRPILNMPMAPKDKKAIDLVEEIFPGMLKTVLIMPITNRKEALGVLQLWSFDKIVKLNATDLDVIRNICSFLSTIISNSILTVVITKILDMIQKKNKIIELRNLELHQEMNLAKQIQTRLMPEKNPVLDGVNFSFFYKFVDEIGGDFFDFIKLREPHLMGLFISDVSGHGVSASLITSMLKTLIETSGEERVHPKLLLEYMNQKLLGNTGSKFVTAFYGLYDHEKKTLKYSRAGHPYPFIIRQNEIIQLEGQGKVLCLFDNLGIEEREIQLQRGDKILLYTDGLTESHNKSWIDFEQVIDQYLLNNCDKPIDDFIRQIYEDLVVFHGNNRFDDDICILGMQIL